MGADCADENAGPATGPQVETAILTGPVEIAPLPWPDACGAESIFLGRTRGEHDPEHGPLERLEYEVYGPMAEKVLQQIARDLQKRYDCRSVRIVHARGAVPPGKASIVIQVATPHRADSFAACRQAIERIKKELPIWKRQIWRDGTSFAEGCAVQVHPSDFETMS